MTGHRAGLTLLLPLLLALPLRASAQQPPKDWPGGRVRFDRSQGSADELKGKFVELLRLLKERGPSRSPIAPGSGPWREA